MKPTRWSAGAKISSQVLLLSMVATKAALAAGASASGTEMDYSTDFMRTSGMKIDVSRFAKGNDVAAGEYRADVYVNHGWIGLSDVTLRDLGQGVQPCFDKAMLERITVDTAKLTQEAASLLAQDAHCAALSTLVPGASAAFDLTEQRLDISLPQVAQVNRARGYVDPSQWDQGVTAARLGYDASTYRSVANGRVTTQSYVGVNAGLNVGAWRLRHTGDYNTSTASGTHYQSVQTSLQRDIASLKSELTVGDAFTDGRIFDSVGFRGVQLATDDRMVPESQRGFAPVIRGIASTNARVQVRQNGNLIYETTVGAGTFEINDLYPTGFGGDLDVIVTEADGSVHTSRVPFAPPVNAVRQGVTRFSVTGGEYRSAMAKEAPWLMQGTVQHGFSNLITGYGGVTAVDGYTAVAAGTALNTRYGAVGMDLTQASTRLGAQSQSSGQSLRLSYSKLVDATKTNVMLGAYRYSTRGYYGLQDAMQAREALSARDFSGIGTVDRARGRLQATINQPLPAGLGSFSLSASSQDYWNRSGRDTQFQAGYNNSFRNVSLGATASRQLNLGNGRWDNQVMFTVGISLGSGGYRPYLSSSVTRDTSGAQQLQESLSGTLGHDNTFAYGVTATAGDAGSTSGSSTGVAANASYLSPLTRLTATASSGRDYSQMGAGMSGGVVVYGGGVAFTPTMGDTMAIVEAKDAAGARVASSVGLKVDPWGHALVADLVPFSRNRVELDPKGLPMNVELQSTLQQVAPTAGAVVKLTFNTANTGRAAILRLTTPDGTPVPFGAAVRDATGADMGTVAQNGRVIVHGQKSAQDALIASWGDEPDQTCHAHYELPAASKDTAPAMTVISVACQPAVRLSTAGMTAASSQRGS